MDDLQDFQGTWQAVWVAEDGRKASADEARTARLTITGNRYTFHRGGYGFHGTISAIDTRHNWGAVDFEGAGGPNGAGLTYRGIYVLEGDELTVCVAPAGKARPGSFESRRGSGHRLYLLRRCVPFRVRPAEELVAAT